MRARLALFEVQLQQGPAVHGLQLLKPGSQGPGAARLILGAAASRPPVCAGLLGRQGRPRHLPGRPVAILAGEPQCLSEEAAVLALQSPVLEPQPGVLFAQPRVLPVPLVPRADGLQVARGQVGEPLLQLLSGAAGTASPAHAAVSSTTPTNAARAALPAAVSGAPAAAGPAPGGATTHAPHRSRPNRAARAVGPGAERRGAGEFGARRGGWVNGRGGEEVAGGDCWLGARGGREFARSEACLVSSDGAAPRAYDLRAGLHTMPLGTSLLLSPLAARGKSVYPLPDSARALLCRPGHCRSQPASPGLQRNHQ